MTCKHCEILQSHRHQNTIFPVFFFCVVALFLNFVYPVILLWHECARHCLVAYFVDIHAALNVALTRDTELVQHAPEAIFKVEVAWQHVAFV